MFVLQAKALEGITESKFAATIAEVMESVTAEAFYHGNVNIADAKVAEDAIISALNESGGASLPKSQYPTELVFQIPSSPNPELVICPTKNVSDANTSVEVYFQIGKDKMTDKVMTDLLTHMMAEPLYDQLRTKDQFGYSVSCDSRWTCGIMGIYFVVVSSVKSAVSTDRQVRCCRQECPPYYQL